MADNNKLDISTNYQIKSWKKWNSMCHFNLWFLTCLKRMKTTDHGAAIIRDVSYMKARSRKYKNVTKPWGNLRNILFVLDKSTTVLKAKVYKGLDIHLRRPDKFASENSHYNFGRTNVWPVDGKFFWFPGRHDGISSRLSGNVEKLHLEQINVFIFYMRCWCIFNNLFKKTLIFKKGTWYLTYLLRISKLYKVSGIFCMFACKCRAYFDGIRQLQMLTCVRAISYWIIW